MSVYNLRITLEEPRLELVGGDIKISTKPSFEVLDVKTVAQLYLPSKWDEDTHSLATRIEEKYLTRGNMKHHGSALSLLYRGLGQYVFENMIDPNIGAALRKIRPGSIVTLELDSISTMVPWELIHDGSDFLCLRHILGRIGYNTPKRAEQKEAKRLVPLLFIADPTGDLRGAQFEANYIIGQLRGSNVRVTRYGSEIRKRVYMDLIRSGRFEIIHYSGHSASSNETGKSHHIFRDGYLFGDEIESLRVSKMPRLVFSNSCQSADSQVSDDTGNTSLAGSYLRAGVNSCIAAIWPVSDRGSAQFASDFYRFLLFGSTIGEALFKSRKESFKRWGYQDFIWGSYLYFGDPTIRL